MKKNIFTLIFSLCFILSARHIAFAQAGTLDITFGNGGKLKTAFPGYDEAHSVVIQTDGKIVLAGRSGYDVSLESAFALVRYNSDGSLDNSFGTGGKVNTNIGVSGSGANSVALQSDGKIVLAGMNNNSSDDDIALVRYNTDGSLDISFANAGTLTTDLGGTNDAANSLTIQSDGKIVVTGSNSNDFATIRYNSDGSLDNTFGIGGKVSTDFGDFYEDAYSIAVQSDGKILVTGISNYNFATARYNADGTLDLNFGTGGKIITTGSFSDISSLAIQSDGKIVLAGNDNNDFALIRYNNDGSLDANFGIGGKVTTDIGGNYDYGYSLAIQSDGRIIVVGVSFASTFTCDFELLRYNSDGSLDNSFGIGGIVATDFGDYDNAYAVSLQSDGKILVVGGGNDNFATARYLSDGSLDNSFGTGGKINTDLDRSGNDVGSSVLVQNDGKIIVSGYSNESNLALARYEANGDLDNSFGIGGKVSTHIYSNSMYEHSFALQSDGKIVGFGYLDNSSFDFSLIRFNTDGSLDSGFNSVGISNFEGNSIAVQNDGKIVVAGSSNYDFALVCYNSDGSLDNGFGIGGMVTTDFGLAEVAYSLALQSDGKIVVTGMSDDSNNTDFATARYNTDGTLDTSFGLGGKVLYGGVNTYERSYSVAIQGDGKIVIGGSTYLFESEFTLVRYHTDGVLDNSFGSVGIVSTDFGGSDSEIRSIAIQNDGKIVAVGYSATDFALARYTIDGDLDFTFGFGGKKTSNFGGNFYDFGYSVALQGDGKIVVAGACDFGGSNSDFALARYNGNLVGISDTIFEESVLAVFPNPFTHSFSVKGTEENGELIIFDVNGKEVLRQSSDEKESKININDFLPGSYMLKYCNKNVIEYHKLLKY